MPSAHALGLGDVRLKLTRPITPSNRLFFVTLGFIRFVGESSSLPAAGTDNLQCQGLKEYCTTVLTVVFYFWQVLLF